MNNRKPWEFCETPEEKCTMNYCDENGCQNRERILVDPIEQRKRDESDKYEKHLSREAGFKKFRAGNNSKRPKPRKKKR